MVEEWGEGVFFVVEEKVVVDVYEFLVEVFEYGLVFYVGFELFGVVEVVVVVFYGEVVVI